MSEKPIPLPNEQHILQRRGRKRRIECPVWVRWRQMERVMVVIKETAVVKEEEVEQ